MSESQLQLAQWLPYKEDRNARLGGRSFYFFDLDNNILNLDTEIVLFHRETGDEISISSEELAVQGGKIGESGPLKDYIINADDAVGTYRNFRDKGGALTRILRSSSLSLIRDIETALQTPAWDWHGPSWNHFFYAVLNRRPVSIITARGHHPATIKRAMNLLHRRGALLRRPNMLTVFPVTNPALRAGLFDDPDYRKDVAELKHRALHLSVEAAFRKYGYNKHHRFGVSDDDPRNVAEITRALVEIKRKYPENSFFVIDSSGGQVKKTEIFPDHTEASESIDLADALNYQLFDF